MAKFQKGDKVKLKSDPHGDCFTVNGVTTNSNGSVDVEIAHRNKSDGKITYQEVDEAILDECKES